MIEGDSTIRRKDMYEGNLESGAQRRAEGRYRAPCSCACSFLMRGNGWQSRDFSARDVAVSSAHYATTSSTNCSTSAPVARAQAAAVPRKREERPEMGGMWRWEASEIGGNQQPGG